MKKEYYRLNVRFDRDTYLKLKKIAERKGLSMSATVPSRIVKWLRDWEPPNQNQKATP